MKAQFLVIFFLVLTCVLVCSGAKYTVSARKVNNQQPVVSSLNGGSTFKYNYNTAVVPLGDSFGLLARCQNLTNPNNIYSVGPSYLALTRLVGKFDENNIQFERITDNSIVFEPTTPQENYGTEDPRIVYRVKDSDYYLLYTAAENADGKITARLSLAITKTPDVKSSWKRYGPLFPEEAWSKSGAMLIRDGFPGDSYLFFGDSTIVRGLQWAKSNDTIHWQLQPGVWLPVRSDNFDSSLVEGGPMPLPLSDGNYLFLYNSARCCVPSKKPGWNTQYNVGYLILDKDDPSKILDRSSEPIISPTLSWEIGDDSGVLGLTPNTVFLEGWIPYPNMSNTFIAFYGAADSVIGAAVISVTITA